MPTKLVKLQIDSRITVNRPQIKSMSQLKSIFISGMLLIKKGNFLDSLQLNDNRIKLGRSVIQSGIWMNRFLTRFKDFKLLNWTISTGISCILLRFKLSTSSCFNSKTSSGILTNPELLKSNSFRFFSLASLILFRTSCDMSTGSRSLLLEQKN